MKKLPVHTYTQGTTPDGPVILKDGVPMAPEQIIAELIRGQKNDQAALDYANIVHDMVVANQSAWIEWQHGKGAEAAMSWIHNGLWGPGHLPDEDAPWGKDAQRWYLANRHDPFPTCICGNPSSQMQMNVGGCCKEHFDEGRKKMTTDLGAKMKALADADKLPADHPLRARAEEFATLTLQLTAASFRLML